jgi:RNA polymerase sigma-70 factor (ECF subfamily)
MTDAAARGHELVVVTATSVLAAPTPRPTQPTLRPMAVSMPARGESRATVFRAMYESHVDFVWRNLRRLGIPASEAEDRTQEVFVVAHKRFGEYEDRGHGPRAWLFQIVLRVASEARRHRRRHPEDPDGGDAGSRASVDAPQAAALARREALSTLDAALETIEVGRRAVLLLHEIEEMTAPEIARVLGIPLNTVYSRLRVAREELETALTRLGLEGGDR